MRNNQPINQDTTKEQPRMRRLIQALTLALLVFGLALPAMAHNFGGSGDCDGWTLNLDGTWGASEIFVDGVSVGLDQTISIPDTSDATSRTFEVRWDKRVDVIVNHTIERELDCDEPLPPAVTVDCLTITIDAAEGVEWTAFIGDGDVAGEGTDSFTGSAGQSWAVVYNDQVIASGVFEACTEETTTTTQPEDTTTTSTTAPPSDSSTTTVPAPTTTTPSAPSTTAPTETPTELPFTGSEDVPLIVSALALFGLGAALVRGTKCDAGESE